MINLKTSTWLFLFFPALAFAQNKREMFFNIPSTEIAMKQKAREGLSDAPARTFPGRYKMVAVQPFEVGKHLTYCPNITMFASANKLNMPK